MNEKLSEKEARFLEKARQGLLASEEQLDAATVLRLRHTRLKAVRPPGSMGGDFSGFRTGHGSGVLQRRQPL